MLRALARLGPRMLFATLAVDGDNPQRWLIAGASPGGLWHTEDGGQTWNQLDGFKHVRATAPRGEGLMDQQKYNAEVDARAQQILDAAHAEGRDRGCGQRTR